MVAQAPPAARRTPFVAAAVVLSAALAACGGDRAASPVPRLDTAHDVVAPAAAAGVGADWLSRPRSLREAVRRADAGAVVTVAGIADGEPVVAAPDEVNATKLVTLAVRDRWFGALPAEVVVNWLGAGDPPYAVGQDYVVLLDRRTDGPWYRPEAPDGRIQIVDGRARPLIEGALAREVAGRSVADLERAVAAAR